MVFTAFLACSNEEAEPGLSSDEKETASFESQDDYYFDDADDLATEAFMSEDVSGGKVSTDTRLTGAIVLRTGTLLSGALKIDFGTGVTDARGNVRKGLILLEHLGQWNVEGASWTITFSGYSINGITIEGTRKVTVVSVTDLITTLEVELIEGKITWPDGSVATRVCHHVRQRVHNGNHLLDRLLFMEQLKVRSGMEEVIQSKSWRSWYTIALAPTPVYSLLCRERNSLSMVPVN